RLRGADLGGRRRDPLRRGRDGGRCRVPRACAERGDSYAVEEALQIRERSGGGEVVVLSAGGREAAQALRRGLAMGADRALRIARHRLPDPLVVARALAPVVAAEEPDLVLYGAQSSDA